MRSSCQPAAFAIGVDGRRNLGSASVELSHEFPVRGARRGGFIGAVVEFLRRSGLCI
jgi:hypothetical protein